MARAGLTPRDTTLTNPYSLSEPNYFAPLQDTAADIALMGNQVSADISQYGAAMSGLLPTVDAAASAQVSGPSPSSLVQYNPTTKEYAVAGQRISGDDYANILRSEELLSQPPQPLAQGWLPVSTETYQQVIAGIKDPSFTKMLGKGFEIGTQNLKTLYGSALQSVTGDEYGGGMVESAATELAKLQPYQRDVADGVTADWFATTLGQQGPMLLESVITALVGAAAGSAAGPGAGTLLGGLAGIFAKKEVKENILKAAAKYNAAKAAAAASGKKLVVDGEVRAARDVLAKAGGVAGAALGSFAGNEVIAAGDIYSEGGTPAEAWTLGLPYAALDLLPEAFVVKRAIQGSKRAMPKGATLGQRVSEYGKRAGLGVATFGTAEGLTETGQEVLVVGAGQGWDAQSLLSPEAANRYLNSFAAGFAVGGLMGGVANLRGNPESRDETNLLDNPPPGTQRDLFPDMPVQAGPPRPPPGGGAVAQPIGQEVSPDQMAFDFGPQQLDLFPLAPTPYGIQPTEDRRVGVAPPEVAPGQLSLLEPTQLPLEGFGFVAPEPVEEISYPDFVAAAEAGETRQVNPAQGVLQFAPPAPSGIRFTEQQPPTAFGQQLLQAQQAQQISDLFDQRAAQQAQQQAQDFPLAQAQQQLQLASASEMGGWDAAGAAGLLPTVEARPTQPTQLDLPVVRQQKRPTRAEKLKRGARQAAPVPEVVPATPQELEAAGQMRLFSDEGQPTIAALKGAGLKSKLPKPKVETGAQQRSPTGRTVNLTVAAKKRAEEAKKTEARADVKKDVTLVSERRVKDATGTQIVELTLSDGSVRRIQRVVGSQTKEGFTGWYDADLLEKPKPYQVAYIADTKQGAINRILADTNAAPTQETPNALQEQSPDEVSARSEPGTGEEVGPEVRRPGKPTGEGKPAAAAKETPQGDVSEGQVGRQVEEEVTPEKKSVAGTPASSVVVAGTDGAETTLNADQQKALLQRINDRIASYESLLQCLLK